MVKSKKDSRPLFLSVLAFLSPLSASAVELASSKSFSLDLTGYFKTLALTSMELATGERYWSDLNRVRLDLDSRIGSVLEARAIIDNEVTAGGWVKTAEFASIVAEKNEPALNLAWEPIYETDRFYGVSLYRAYMRFDRGPLLATVGRQKIDWGVMRILSPEDLATPLTIFQVERDQKTGVDALSVEYRFGERWRVHTYGAAGKDLDASRLGARVTHTVGRFQLSGFGGRFLRDPVVGVDFTGDVGDTGLRGEILHFWGTGGDRFFQGSIGADYALSESWYALIEYFHNGQAQGRFNPRRLVGLATANRIKTLYRHFISGQLEYDVTPLLAITLTGIFDVEGQTLFAAPELKYEAVSWLVFTGGAQLPFGKKQGEFERLPHLYFLQGQVYF